MPKKDSKGREYIEQDGKRYYRNLWGKWEAEKAWLGNDKINTDIFGKPKIETDILGNPYVKPEKKDDGDFYLTTACMCVMQDMFDDNCQELTILRNFRDTYVKEYHPETIVEYYRTAPNIVRAIKDRTNSQEIYQNMYSNLVQVMIDLIRIGKYEDAYILYKNYGENMAMEYGVA